MKDGIHPQFRPVIFKDISCNFEYLTMSTVKTKETAQWKDGKEYPIVKFEVSSSSHPFYTGKHRVMDTEGRAEKFKKKYAKKA
ncbi:MAG: type B 50S ribosomal protein L31 [Bdellovibrionota bacterium]